jgi:sugar phosphate isomerase/epimerase
MTLGGMKISITSWATALVCLTATALWGAPAPKEKQAGIGGSFRGPIGLQLYSLRNEFAKDVPGTLAKVRDYGIKYVELAGTYKLHPLRFKEMLDAHGLVPIAGHFSYEQYRDKIEEVIKEAKILGLQYAGCAWIPHKAPFDEAQARAAIAVFNKAGEALAKEGIKFFYHVHGYEFHPYKNETLMDLMIKETKPEYVAFQMDVLWVFFPGQDPAKWLQKYGSRWELMHLKDLKQGVARGSLSGSTDVSNDVVLGTGQVNYPEVLRAARRAKVKWYFIEDESPTAAEQIPQSLQFLERVRF